MTMVSVGIWVVLVMVMIPQESWGSESQSQSQSQSQSSCVPSSCGKISNISHPFRRKDDPPTCGDSRYELECVNGVAVLRLSGEGEAEYHVQAINYNNYTIRLVDPNVEDNNCSTIPRHFLYRFNFSDARPLFSPGIAPHRRDVALYDAMQFRSSDFDLFDHIIYMSCNRPVMEHSTNVYNYTSCLGDLHTYVVALDLMPAEWRPDCHVKLSAPTSGCFQLRQRQYHPEQYHPEPNISYSEIHRALAYGFELSWLPPICQRHCGSAISCYFDDSIQEAVCYHDDAYCNSRLCSKNNTF